MTSPKMVVIDGPKGVGKSTICQRLVELLKENGQPAVYHKHVRDPQNEYKAMIRLVISSQYDSDQVVVVDRLHWTEWVMGIYTGRAEARNLTEECRLIDNCLEGYAMPNIILTASNTVLRRRLAVRQDVDRQKVDMPWDLIQPIWTAAWAQSKAKKFSNETADEQNRILNYLLVLLGCSNKWAA